MDTLILYCIVCYLIMIGMFVEENSKMEKEKTSPVWTLILAPLIVPIFIGMKIL